MHLEDSEFEDSDGDDAFMAAYREQRLLEMRGLASGIKASSEREHCGYSGQKLTFPDCGGYPACDEYAGDCYFEPL